ncbi:multidrug transporter AcrB [Ahniella affigens]|uniref:Multidrug transporter AcrB n=1 Tax=Ahniella affigens TaxID=2021234 RepID=A0A2P1PN25_9GAMM|nr:efflux RND transporter permease subunit [Ahniella affigens]AVP96228.1 multidrug transporter AcrB [Ahniella affigens]
MNISELCIRRPVFATVINLLIILIGVVCYTRLPVRQTPKIDTPVVNVNTFYPGANAAVIESQITKPIEDALAGIEGVDFIQSNSRAEQSNVTVVFNLDRSPDGAASDVRDRVNQAREFLPLDAREPVVQKQEADSQPIIWLSFNSDRHSQLEVADYARRLVKDRLQAIPGVAEARLFAAQYSMRIWLDADRLAAQGLTPDDVERALRNQNVEIPAGRIESTEREFTVLAETDLGTPEQFMSVVLRDDPGYLVRLGDVARIELGPDNDRWFGRFNGKPAVPLGLVRQSVANPLDISKGVKAALPEIQQQLPEGMSVEIGYDSTIFIQASLDAVYEAVIEAVALVVLVIFLFLRSARATIIPLVTIPVSLIGACVLMYAFGFSINTLTLLALVLAIGLVVDDAIVMLENVHRHIELGKSRFAAAIEGAKEISFAIIAMTLTLAAVYLPVAFSAGATGRLFVEFALTLAGAVIVSGFVALTLSPMMCSKLLADSHQTQGWFYELGERWLNALTDIYKRWLAMALRTPGLVVSVATVLGLGAIALFLVVPMSRLPSELAPKEDPGFVFTFGMGPEGATVQYMDRYARMIEAAYAEVPEIERYFVFVGWPSVNNTMSFPRLKDWSERDRSAEEVAGELFGRFTQIPGIMAFPQVPAALGGGFNSRDFEMVVQTTESYERLGEIMAAMKAELGNDPRFIQPRADLEMNKPELRVNLNRDKTASVGADIATVGRTLETLMGGRNVTRFKRGSEQYNVIVQLDKGERQTPDALTAVYVRSRTGDMVQLSNLLDVSETVAPRELAHFNKLRSASISASLAPGFALGEAITAADAALRKVARGEATYDLSGQSREFRKVQSSSLMLFGLALAFIYLVLAAQFESFLDPMVILLSVPLAIAGALLTLKLTGGSINVYSQIGLITLVGLIAKHGILIVEFSHQLRDRGLSLLDATIEASSLRLRPILMTTAAMALGALPLALAAGAGAEARQDIGWVIVGGLSIGTLFTLFVVPSFYVLLGRWRQRASVGARAHSEQPAH